jgi:hypothetical protein
MIFLTWEIIQAIPEVLKRKGGKTPQILILILHGKLFKQIMTGPLGFEYYVYQKLSAGNYSTTALNLEMYHLQTNLIRSHGHCY